MRGSGPLDVGQTIKECLYRPTPEESEANPGNCKDAR